MRSSKSRSRSKSNRPRSLGNIVNRVFDSSGPEGKVRGTPAQIIEKYLFLARDAQLSNDRVAAENFLQHAEHYTRMLGEAQRELAAEQEQRRVEHPQGQNGGGQPQHGNQRQDRRDDRPRDDRPRDDRPREDRRDDRPRDDRAEQPRAEREPRQHDSAPPSEPPTSSHEVIDLDERSDDDSGLVETPETRPRHRPAPRRRPEPAAEPAPPQPPEPTADEPAAAPAAEDQPKADRPRRPRGPRKPKPRDENGTPDGDGPREAAE
ncbi:uncharacterized protein DUF4167 [Cereibacter ovatus]|uniref:Uncharacterized protein DUF4167 n=1 Tax=Cereibacter ovatus TaxID=439529 RepID=A0A285CTY9_9RHOB|nr:DUF4167 domain-containing protein [Cereibacter ovatus]SNX70528.1 uncharacterized protein DUF4167 [Cereibacter ovatus]